MNESDLPSAYSARTGAGLWLVKNFSDYFVIKCISIPIKTVEKGLVSEPWAFNLKILQVPSAGMPGLAVRGELRLNQVPGKVACV